MEIDGHEIAEVYLGDKEISNAYIGDKLIIKGPPLYAAYCFLNGDTEQWAYVKYPLDGSRVVRARGENMIKANSSSQLTYTTLASRVSKEIVYIGDPYSYPYTRDYSADLYT